MGLAAESKTSTFVLSAHGEMAARVRALDAAGTPLGPSSTWPPALRVALDICLNSTFPTAIYWGQDLILLYNDAWRAIPAEKHPWAFGRPAREVWSDIWHIVGPQLASVMQRGEGVALYDQMLPMLRGGAVCETYWDYSFTPIRDEHGAVLGVLNQGHETTGRVLSQRNRETELARFQALFEQAPIPTALLQGPEHVYAMANEAYLRLIGRRDILHKPVVEALPEIIEQGFGDVLDRAYRKGESYVARATPIMLRRDPMQPEEERVLDFVVQPLKDAAGGVIGVFVQAMDVTERARAEAALRASEHNLRKLNEHLETLVADRTSELSDAIKTLQALVNRMRTTLQTSFIFQGYVDPTGKLLEANAESLAAIEAQAEDVIGRYFWDTPWFTATPGMPAAVRQALMRVVRGEAFRSRVDIVLPGGVRTFDFSMRPVKDEQGEVIGIVAEAVDLTRLMQAEERLRQSQKMEAIGQLTGGIAHDFNNLLTGIIGSLDMMQRRVAQGHYDRLETYAKAALASANRAAALTHRLLAFARRQPLDPKPVDANALIGEMQDMLRRTLGERIRLNVLAAGALWLTRCDPNQLDSAILNLAINARDAMPNGGTITIETSNVEVRESDEVQVSPGEYVCIRVQDTGSGMSADVIAKAFDPFFTTKPLGQGTGLGLSMTYGFVRQSGGDITIKSTVGEGTDIRLYLPRFTGEPVRAEPSGAETGRYRTLGHRTVLVVEDDEVVRRLIVEMLAELGFAVIEARDGEAGLEALLSDRRIDLLITDVGLPKLNGRRMVELAKEHRPRLRTLYITGYAQADATMEDLGPRAALVTKPFPMEVLAQRIQEMMSS